MIVRITGKDVAPMARLLDALTVCNLLNDRLTWEENGDRILLHIEDYPNEKKKFQDRKFEVSSIIVE